MLRGYGKDQAEEEHAVACSTSTFLNNFNPTEHPLLSTQPFERILLNLACDLWFGRLHIFKFFIQKTMHDLVQGIVDVVLIVR